MAAFCRDIATCTFIQEYDASKVLTASSIMENISLIMEAVYTSETSVYFYETASSYSTD
jgi:hypothetical protein